MKELVGTGANLAYAFDPETKKFQPQAEIILMLSEPQYVLSDDGIEKSRAKLDTFRFVASPAGIGVLVKSLVETMEEIKKQVEIMMSTDDTAEAGEVGEK